MPTIQHTIQVEGTWEELLRRGEQFAGKRVRITVLPEEDQAELRRRAAKVMADVDASQPDPKRRKLLGTAGGFADAVADKLRDQGIQS